LDTGRDGNRPFTGPPIDLEQRKQPRDGTSQRREGHKRGDIDQIDPAIPQSLRIVKNGGNGSPVTRVEFCYALSLIESLQVASIGSEQKRIGWKNLTKTWRQKESRREREESSENRKQRKESN
jgi:hypothetical protein